MNAPEPSPEQRPPRLGKTLTVVALIAVGTLIAIGATDVLSAGGDTGRAVPTDGPSLPAPPTPAGGRYLPDIDYVDIRSGATTPLPMSLRGLSQARRFLVSPDGRTFAFEASVEYQFQVFVAGIRGHGIRQLTHGAGARLGGWSPDGTSLVIAVDDRLAPTGRIAVLDVDAGFARPVTPRGYVFAPSFASDGQSILYSRAREVRGEVWRTDLWRVSSSGGPRQMVIAFATLGSESPDGSTIAYHRTVGVQDAFCGACWWHDLSQTYVPSDGSEQPGPARGGEIAPPFVFDPMLPRWSPDGRWILSAGVSSGAASDIYLRPAEGGGSRQIAVGLDPTWFDERTLIVTDGRRFET